MDAELLLEVYECFTLTGLGVMLLPTGSVAALERLELHTVWPVVLAWPDGRREVAVASVEEITRHEEHFGKKATQERGLLLTHEEATKPPPGTRVFRLPTSPDQ